jgi:dipeptide/tripeptide permease
VALSGGSEASGLQFANAEGDQRSRAAPWLVRLPSSFYAMPSLISLLRFRLIVFLSLSVARLMMARAASSAVTPVDPAAVRGKAIAVPFLQRLTGERLTGSVALISENSDLVHQVGDVAAARTTKASFVRREYLMLV